MNHSHLIKQITRNLRHIEDESHLQMLHDLTALYAGNDKEEFLEFYAPAYLENLEKSIRQSRIGNTASHESAKQIAIQWLGE